MEEDGKLRVQSENEELRKAKVALLERSVGFKAIAENIDETFWATDPEIKEIFYVSPAYEKISGQTCESLYRYPKSFFDVIYSEDRKQVLDALDLMKAGQKFECECRVIKQDGSVRWVLARGFPVMNSEGKITVYVGVIRDITERKNIVDTIRKGKQFAESILNAVQCLVVILDDRGRILRFNSYAEKITGYRSKEVEGKDWFDTFLSKGEPLLMGHEEPQAGSGVTVHGNIKFLLTKDGRRVLVEWSDEPLRDERGQMNGLILTGHDVTERYILEKDLFTSDLRYRRLHESMIDAFAEVNMDGYIVDCNQSYQTMLGYTLEELKKLTYQDLTPAKWHDYEEKIIAEEVLVQGYSRLYEKEYIHKDGTVFPVELRTVLVRDEISGRPVSMWAVIRDITERVRTQEALRKSEKLYHSLFDNMLNGFAYCRMIYEQDQPRDFLYLHVNDAFEKLTGLKNVVGKKFSEVLPGLRESNPEILEIYDRVSSSGKPEKHEAYSDAFGGWLSIVVYSPEKGYFVAVFDNVSGQKKLQETFELHGFIMKNLSEGVCLIRADNQTIVYSNPKFEEMFGYASGELIGQNISIINAPGDRSPAEVAKDICDILREKRSWHGEIKNIKKNGETFWCYASVTTFEHPQYGPVWASVHTDISERKKIEAELEISVAKMKEQSRLLEHKNIAFQEVIKSIEVEKNELRNNIGLTVSELIMPILKKIKLKGASQKYLDLLKNNLETMVSPFGRKISDIGLKLTPKEIEICNMIKSGLTTKEISTLLTSSPQTVDKHRKNIRKKLGLSKKGGNLTAFLQGLNS